MITGPAGILNVIKESTPFGWLNSKSNAYPRQRRHMTEKRCFVPRGRGYKLYGIGVQRSDLQTRNPRPRNP